MKCSTVPLSASVDSTGSKMEDYSQVYTVEVMDSKGWEVAKTFTQEGKQDAIDYFTRLMLNGVYQARLTSPEVK